MNRSEKWAVRVVIEDELNKKQYSHSIDRCAWLDRWGLGFPLASVELRIPIWVVVGSLSFFSICRWCARRWWLLHWRRFLRGRLTKDWLRLCFIVSEREVRVNYISFQIMGNHLSKKIHGCLWCMGVDFLAFFDRWLLIAWYFSPVSFVFIAVFSLTSSLVGFSSARLTASRINLVLFDPPFR